MADKPTAAEMMGLVPLSEPQAEPTMVHIPIPNVLCQVVKTSDGLGLTLFMGGSERPLQDAGFQEGDLVYVLLASRLHPK